MKKILFEKLTIREEEKIRSGETIYPDSDECMIDPFPEGDNCPITLPDSECAKSHN